jgi:LuxR family transcriptional regulator, maltose regulon positive regulatory protein
MDAELAMLKAVHEIRRGSVHEAARCIARAASQLQSVPDDRRANAEARLIAVRLERARHCGDLRTMVEEAQQLLVYTGASDAGNVAGVEELRAFALIGLGLASIWTEPGSAEAYFEEGVRVARCRGLAYLEVLARAHWALAASLRSPAVGIDLSQEAIAAARRHGWSETTVIAPAYIALGLVSTWQGWLEDAERWLKEAARALAGESEPALDCLFHFARGALELVRGADRHAMNAYRDAAQHAERLVATHPLKATVRAHVLHASLRLGDADRVAEAMSTFDTPERESPAMCLALAALRLVQGEPASACNALAPMLVERDRLTTTAVSSIYALLLEAIACDALGDRSESERRLEHALDLAETDGVLWPFLVERGVRSMLERHVQRRTAHAHLVTQMLDVLGGRRRGSRALEAPTLVEPMSESELRVLRFLPTNLSAPEIGRELFVSVNTVKTHMRHIYAKLGAHTRTEVVEAARGLGLLAPSAKRCSNGATVRATHSQFSGSSRARVGRVGALSAHIAA